MKLTATLTLITAAVAAAAVAGCAAGGARPYRAMAKAASSEESVLAQIDDHRLKASLREALLLGGAGTSISAYVYMGHAYLVGFVEGDEQRRQVLDAARGVGGLRSVDAYLPDAPAGGSTKAADLALEGEVKAALAMDQDQPVTRIDLEVLAGHVVLLGVAGSEDAREAVESDVSRVGGVDGVTNFLLVPEEGYERLRPGLR
jgi:osmotically-inducible protein OsmY